MNGANYPGPGTRIPSPQEQIQHIFFLRQIQHIILVELRQDDLQVQSKLGISVQGREPGSPGVMRYEDTTHSLLYSPLYIPPTHAATDLAKIYRVRAARLSPRFRSHQNLQGAPARFSPGFG